ncbi:phage head-tail connector protein [Paracoccus fontiphilus]|uniref:Phage head-tail connector protein n=1 Tax=Paracoccus fontiphilus TaxID=1815556 RepID=A0ABV7IJ57_9RHOB|nr:phage head-tail connector protein [Paracoccus fontiphilus]
MTYTRTPISLADPFDLDEVKHHARVDGDHDDMALARMARAAAREIEAHCELALLRQLITVTVQAEGEAIPLPCGPAVSNAAVTVDGLALVNGLTGGRYPVLHLPDDMRGAVVVTYEAGFGDDAASIPDDLQLAIMDQATRSYDLRGSEDAAQGLSLAASRIAARHRRVRA